MSISLLLLSFAHYHLPQQLKQVGLAQYIHPLRLDGAYHEPKEVCLLHKQMIYAAEGLLDLKHMSQLLEVLEVLEPVDHEQGHESDTRDGRFEDKVGEEHFGLVGLAYLYSGGVESGGDQALVVRFVTVPDYCI